MTEDKCSICKKPFKVDEDGEVLEEDEDGNTLVLFCDECDSDQQKPLCPDCITNFENAGVDFCSKCLKITERVVEKIVEKPVYVKQDNISQVSETMEEFEKRIMG